MTYYNDSYRRKQAESDRTRYEPVKTPQWHVARAELVFHDEGGVELALSDEVSKKRLVQTLQFLCNEAPAVGGGGLPSLLDVTSESYIKSRPDGGLCLQMSRREYAIMTAALLPSYLEPSRKNIKRAQGFRSVAMHPVLMRYVLRKTDDAGVNKWRTWAAVRTLAGYVNATVSSPASLDYSGGVYPITGGFFVVYELLPRVLDAIFQFYKTAACFVHALQETTIVYDVMAAFLMPCRLEYINYRLIDEVLNLTELDNMDAFCQHHSMLIGEVRKLAEAVKHLDDHSRARIKVDREGVHSHINIDLLLMTMFNAACDPRLDRNAAMAMMCSVSVAQRSNKAIYAFLDAIPTPSGQYNKRVHDLYTRLTIGLRPCDHADVGREMMRDIMAGRYDRELGLCDPPPKYKRPRFQARYIHGDYTTPTFANYAQHVKRGATPVLDERPGLRQPMQALYLFVSSFDRNFAKAGDRYYDSWDLLSANMLDCEQLLPLTVDGHYLDRAFFYIYKSARM